MSAERLNDEPAHAPYGPSRADGYTGCLDYVRANEGLPDDTSEQAAEGTFAHLISDECLSLGGDADDYIGLKLKVAQWTFEWAEEDAHLLQRGIDWVRAHEGDFYGEQRVDVSPWTCAGQFGTLDRAVVTDHGILISDLKFGRGVPVSPIENKQLTLYALGFWETVKHRFDSPPPFAIHIDQPRCSGGGGIWKTSLAELEEIGAYIRSRVQESIRATGPLPRTPSEAACIWCKRKLAPGGCGEYDQWRIEQLEPFLTGTSLTAEQRAEILRHRKGIEYWFKQLEEAALEDTLNGLPGGGMKAVVDTRKGTRDKWNDEAAVAELLNPILGEQCFTKKLKTVKQIAKQLSPEDQEKLNGLYKPAEHGFSLVPAEDTRPAVVRDSGDDFEDLA